MIKLAAVGVSSIDASKDHERGTDLKVATKAVVISAFDKP